jgi:predicted TIM-barrel fold metal-dependent hydrolase
MEESMNKMQSRRNILKYGLVGGVASFGTAALAQFGQLEMELDPNTRRALNIPEGEELPADAIYGPWREMRGVKEKRVIDMHHHAWETRTQGRTYYETGDRHAQGDFVDFSDAAVASFDRHGIALATLIPAFVPFEQVVETSYAKHKDRYILTAGLPTREMVRQGKTVDDLTPREVASIYRRMLTEYKVSHIGETAGGAMRSIAQRMGPKALAPVVDVILEFNVPVQFDPGSWSPTGTARGPRTYRSSDVINQVSGPMIAAYPDVQFIVAHAGGQFWQLDGAEVMRLLFSLENTYTEISKSFNSDLITTLVRGIGPERVMYGSDWNRPQMKAYGPHHLRTAYQHWNSLNTLARADLNEDERDWVLYKSARRLLKLDENRA